MASAGSYLRGLREQHGVSLDELAQVTRINPRFLEALEADDFAALPAGPFSRGFIKSYCEALHEPADEPLALYATSSPARVPRHSSVAPPRARRSLAPLLVSLALLVILGAALAAVTLALRSGRGDSVAQRAQAPAEPAPVGPRASAPSATGQAPHAPAPMVLEGPQARPAPSPGAKPGAGPEGPSPRPQFVPGRSPYHLVVRATEATWIRVRTGDGRTSEETIPAGDVREWVSNHPFELRLGNAGGISLELNGQPLPSPGPRGAVVNRLVVPAEPR